jgi:hypothetical protein
MNERKKGLPEAIRDQGLALASAAVKRVLDDPRGQELVAAAVGAAQKGKRRVEEVQGRVLRAAGLPTRGDYEEVGKSMARLKRKLRDLSRLVEGTGNPGGGKR